MRGFGYARTTQCAVRWRLGDDLCDVLNLRAVRGRKCMCRAVAKRTAIWCACGSRKRGRFQGCLLRWASGPWENQQAYFLLPRRNRSTPACSTTRGRSGQGPGTRPAKPCRFVLTVALRVRLRPRGAEYVFAEQFQWAGTPGSTAAPLSMTTALTELRHRTLDDFDSVTSLATSSSRLNRMSIF
ncbi:hypothetical protein HPB50_024022 [Hyalomma asiaticum]|uniref:Uncharacterized protein n=1 Tax=Hyalomma asiaticum TaxID=266040 RepID=A0ACB7SZJ0_HYAAI|nr:hypothetical protein HPB50_024022 [Hyalomma asiaticum]